jgi:uncharacterized protein YndB with AHSA1/START domain
MRSDVAVVKSLEISASTTDVWGALTEPDRIVRWMGGARVESTWELGGDITFTGKLHDMPYRDRGTVLAIEPERLLAYSHWTRLSRLPDVPENRTVISFNLDWTGEKTRLTVRHQGFLQRSRVQALQLLLGLCPHRREEPAGALSGPPARLPAKRSALVVTPRATVDEFGIRMAIGATRGRCKASCCGRQRPSR